MEFIKEIFQFAKEVFQLVVTGIIIIAVSYVLYSLLSPTEQEKRRIKKETKEKETEKRLYYSKQYQEISSSLSWVHLYGLPVSELAVCDVWECKNCLVFYCGHPYVLNYSKIINAEYMSQTEVTKHYYDDATGAIAGGLMFGPIGALIGGGTEVDEETKYRYFVRITYKSENGTNDVLFNVTDAQYSAKNFVRTIKKHINYSDRSAVDL